MSFPVRVVGYIIRDQQFRLIESLHGVALSFTTTAGRHAMMTEDDATHSVPVSGQSHKSSALKGWRTRRLLALGAFAFAVVLGACNGGIPSPSRDASQGQVMMDLAEALNQMRDQSAGLQDQLDSLRDVVYQQDTVIRKLAFAAGVPVPPVR